MKVSKALGLTTLALSLAMSQGAVAQKKKGAKGTTKAKTTTTTKKSKPVSMTPSVSIDRFADLEVLRYEINGFDKLTPKQKELAYYLYEASLSGRDMIWDQKYKHNLRVRKTIEAIYNSYSGDKSTAQWRQFETWSKRVFFSNGMHHHYSQMKLMPEFDFSFFEFLLKNSDAKQLPLDGGSVDNLASMLKPVLFDKAVDFKNVNLDKDVDRVKASANNLYVNVTQEEVDAYYEKIVDKNDKSPVMYGLNSQMRKTSTGVEERQWKVGGMYTESIEKIVFWLEKAAGVAENPAQKEAIEKLVKFYRSGDLKDFDAYNIAWVRDTESLIDMTNGFIEVYGDALGKRGAYEAVVSIKDMEATKKIAIIAKNAQWFEDNSPIADSHKKKNVQGITAKVITVIVESGDAAPSTPIGINLPNSNWIRERYGSKSVSLGNIVEAYNIAGAQSPVGKEFHLDEAHIARAKMYGNLASELHTDMHEVIGHASGKLNDGIGTPDQTLKNYANTLEEARADLVALYYIYDQKLVDIGVMPSLEVGKAEYESYLLSGLMLQLNRLDLGEQLEEAHMRNRQLNCRWVYEKGKAENVVELVKRNGKTYVRINDYAKLRTLFGQLLKEIQRIKSEGDYAAATELVENYGVKVDVELHKEVKQRFSKLNVAPYKGFVQPRLIPVYKGKEIVDVKVGTFSSFLEEQLYYGKEYDFLPISN